MCFTKYLVCSWKKSVRRIWSARPELQDVSSSWRRLLTGDTIRVAVSISSLESHIRPLNILASSRATRYTTEQSYLRTFGPNSAGICRTPVGICQSFMCDDRSSCPPEAEYHDARDCQQRAGAAGHGRPPPLEGPVEDEAVQWTDAPQRHGKAEG